MASRRARTAASDARRSAFLSTLEMAKGEITDCHAFFLSFPAAEGGTELLPERRTGAPGPSNAPVIVHE